MKNKIFLAAIAALTAVTLTACGEVDTDDNNSKASSKAAQSTTDTENVTSQVVTDADINTDITNVSEDDTTTPDITSDENSSDEIDSQTSAQSTDVKLITGIFLESINGAKSNYVIYNDSTKSIISIDGSYNVPIDIAQKDTGILVSRGGVSDETEYVPYTDDGTSIEFTYGDKTYVWTRIDYIPVSGSFNEVDSEGTILGNWTFNSDGTGTVTDSETQTSEVVTYTQTASEFVVSKVSTGDKTTYSYTFDGTTLVLTSSDETITLMTSGS